VPNLYARAYAKGINADLVAAGTVVYPSKIAADIAADSVGDHVFGGVDFLALPEGVPTKLASAAIEGLTLIAKDMCDQAKGYSPELSKVASAADPIQVARFEAFALIKLAEEGPKNPETTPPAAETQLGTGKNPAMTNGAPNASATGVAVDAPAKTDGADGIPGAAVEGDEHAIGGHGTTPAQGKYAADKVASFALRMQAKIAATTTKNPESVESSPKTEQSATGEMATIKKVDDPSKPLEAGADELGTEQAQKTASYLARVEKTASAVLPFLPSDLPEYAALAHVRAMSKLASVSDQGKYLVMAYGGYGFPAEKAIELAQEYVKRASDKKVDGDDADEGETDEGETDDGSSDDAIAMALNDAASEIETSKKSEEDESAMKTAAAPATTPASAMARLAATI
jgi:hypothetical protein